MVLVDNINDSKEFMSIKYNNDNRKQIIITANLDKDIIDVLNTISNFSLFNSRSELMRHIIINKFMKMIHDSNFHKIISLIDYIQKDKSKSKARKDSIILLKDLFKEILKPKEIRNKSEILKDYLDFGIRIHKFKNNNFKKLKIFPIKNVFKQDVNTIDNLSRKEFFNSRTAIFRLNLFSFLRQILPKAFPNYFKKKVPIPNIILKEDQINILINGMYKTYKIINKK